MRTTLSLDDDILAAAKVLAASENASIGAVISRLARRGLAPDRPRPRRGGFPVFDLPTNSPVVTVESVRRALDEQR
jgi:hypothetical protein